MANNGSLVVDIESLVKLSSDVFAQSNKIIENYYAQFQKLYILSNSSYIKGDYADALKAYLNKGVINLNSGIMDALAAIQTELVICQKAFSGIESDSGGVISEERINSINDFLNGVKNGYANTEGEVFGHLCEASSYISTSDVPLDDVKQAFDWTGLTFFDICNSIEQADQLLLSGANAMYDRIVSLKNQIINVRNNCYSGGYLDLNCASWLNDVNNNPQLPNMELQVMLNEHPFDYVADGVAIAEDQWAAGLTSDIYAYAGYSLLSASYEAGYDENSAFVKAKASVLEANAYAQLTDYASVSASAKFIYAEGEAKAGWGDGYYGAQAHAEVGVAKVEASAVLGSDAFNIHGDAWAKVACADAAAYFEFEPEDGTFHIGAGAHAIGASAGVSAGTTLFGVDHSADNAKDMLGFDVEASVGVQAGGGVDLQSTKAIEGEFANVNVLSVDIDLEVLLGAEIKLNVPYIHFKW